ncbi:unnamed protein product [Cuscuta epithymum]|uniref:Uncharacterized protein n=1 Tax=Cuscuta epithymum TaxID=186058 RepID=A0AAV0DY93_9ASTE|nr:unnamed protein product [Cuscuta epithymum]
MVKLATARDCRTYGPGASRNRSEYINAGLYLFSTIVLLCGFAAELSREPKSGLVLLLFALVLVAVVNIHDLVAHLAGIDYRICLFAYDPQLALIEFAAPLMHILGCVCSFLGILFLFIKAEKGSDQFMELEKHGLNLLIAGPALWLLGSILNSCQIYERAGGHVQILQQSVHIPFLMASLLLLVGAILNYNDTQNHHHQHVAHHSRFKSLLGGKWVWLGICGSLLLFAGGLANVVKVFKMQQMDGEMRLEKLRGGAQDRLVRERDGRGMPLISGDFPPLIADDGCRWRRDRQPVEEGQQAAATTPTPYKDVLVSDV